MILSRRHIHFYLISALCCVLPLVAIAAMIWRPSVPSVEQDDLFRLADFAPSDPLETVQEFAPLMVQESPVVAKVVRREAQLYLEITPQTALEFSDILVYWLPPSAQADEIDEQAILLGQLSGSSRRQFVLPAGLLETSNQLLFYSRGQSKVIATVSLERNESQQQG